MEGRDFISPREYFIKFVQGSVFLKQDEHITVFPKSEG
jgi:hypothetical protein